MFETSFLLQISHSHAENAKKVDVFGAEKRRKPRYRAREREGDLERLTECKTARLQDCKNARIPNAVNECETSESVDLSLAAASFHIRPQAENTEVRKH